MKSLPLLRQIRSPLWDVPDLLGARRLLLCLFALLRPLAIGPQLLLSFLLGVLDVLEHSAILVLLVPRIPQRPNRCPYL